MNTKLNGLLAISELQIQASSLFVQAESIKASGDYEKTRQAYAHYIEVSKNYLQASLDFNQQFPESPNEIPPIARPLVNALMVQADVVQSLGDREAAERLSQEAHQVSKIHLDRKSAVDTERSRAGAMILEGRFNEAIMILMNTRDAVMEEANPLDLARISIDLADVLQWLGDYRRAKEEIEHAERLIAPALEKGRPTHTDIAQNLLSSIAGIMAGDSDVGNVMQSVNLYRTSTEIIYYRGLISKALGEWDKAEQCLNKVLPEYQKLQSGEAIEFALAQVKLGRGQFSLALEQIRQIAPVFEGGPFRSKKGVLQRFQAECLMALGKTDRVRELVDESIADLTEKHFDPDALWRSQWLRAKIAVQEADVENIVKYFQDAINTITSLRRSPLGYRLNSTFMADKKDLFSDAIGKTLNSGHYQECCQFMESIKSRTLTAVTSIPHSNGSKESDLEKQIEAMTASLDSMEYQAYRKGWNRHRKLAHLELSQQRANLLERIRISDPRWRRLSEPLNLDTSALLEQLSQRRQAALTLYYDPPLLSTLLLFNGQIKGEVLNIPEAVVGKLEEYTLNLQDRNYDPFVNDLSVNGALKAMDLIPSTLLSEALKADSFIVIPHGTLHLLPWSGLVNEERRLFERLPVGVLPNLSVLANGGDVPTPRRVAFVGISDYPDLPLLKDLPSAVKEVEDIGRIYECTDTETLSPLLNETATEIAFWDLIQNLEVGGNVLHISCHGIIMPDEPMSSGLLLFDSKVDAAEIARSRWPFDEVVLSACSTGWRPTQVAEVTLNSDDILGIPAGFMEAGTSTLLASITKAEGKAARTLTTHYHKRRASGDSPLFAYKSAQEHLLSQGVSPGTWIGFTLYGCV